jgi:hypothetical protein
MGSLIIADRVLETTATTGTGPLVLAGAKAGFRSFAAAIGVGNSTYYGLKSGDGTSWEIGLGTIGGANGAYTLSRDTIQASANAGAAISLTGTSEVWCDLPASAVTLGAASATTLAAETARAEAAEASAQTAASAAAAAVTAETARAEAAEASAQTAASAAAAAVTAETARAEAAEAVLAPASASLRTLAFCLVGKPAASQPFSLCVTQAGTLLANGGAPEAYISTVPTATQAFTLNVIRSGTKTTLGTISISTAGVVTWPTFAATALAAGDTVQLVNQATQDSTFTNACLSLQYRVS